MVGLVLLHIIATVSEHWTKYYQYKDKNIFEYSSKSGFHFVTDRVVIDVGLVAVIIEKGSFIKKSVP